MASANLRGKVVDERPSTIGVHHFGDLAELLQSSKDRVVLLPIAIKLST
jgi:hypothetical protein